MNICVLLLTCSLSCAFRDFDNKAYYTRSEREDSEYCQPGDINSNFTDKSIRANIPRTEGCHRNITLEWTITDCRNKTRVCISNQYGYCEHEKFKYSEIYPAEAITVQFQENDKNVTCSITEIEFTLNARKIVFPCLTLKKLYNSKELCSIGFDGQESIHLNDSFVRCEEGDGRRNFWGETCDKPCACYQGEACHSKTGECFGCQPKRWGPNCTLECNCLHEFCPISTGVCSTGCMKGYIGSSCNISCTYGPNCYKQCFCNLKYCNYTTGHCSECNHTHFGADCSQQCPHGKYLTTKTAGNTLTRDDINIDTTRLCTKNCNCRYDTDCEVTTGLCIKKCKSGYQPIHIPNSTKVECRDCPLGNYGHYCRGVCRCISQDKCHKVSGDCQGDDCQLGYKGNDCQSVCDKGEYGMNCKEKCRCKRLQDCDRMTGHCQGGDCEDGFQGSNCQTEIVTVTTRLPELANNTKINTPAYNTTSKAEAAEVEEPINVALILACLFSLLFIICVFVALYIFKQKRRRMLLVRTERHGAGREVTCSTSLLHTIASESVTNFLSEDDVARALEIEKALSRLLSQSTISSLRKENNDGDRNSVMGLVRRTSSKKQLSKKPIKTEKNKTTKKKHMRVGTQWGNTAHCRTCSKQTLMTPSQAEITKQRLQGDRASMKPPR